MPNERMTDHRQRPTPERIAFFQEWVDGNLRLPVRDRINGVEWIADLVTELNAVTRERDNAIAVARRHGEHHENCSHDGRDCATCACGFLADLASIGSRPTDTEILDTIEVTGAMSGCYRLTSGTWYYAGKPLVGEFSNVRALLTAALGIPVPMPEPGDGR